MKEVHNPTVGVSKLTAVALIKDEDDAFVLQGGHLL